MLLHPSPFSFRWLQLKTTIGRSSPFSHSSSDTTINDLVAANTCGDWPPFTFRNVAMSIVPWWIGAPPAGFANDLDAQAAAACYQH
jgi:hypothetical protein